MRIIIIGTAYPYKGGLASFNERLAKEFQNQGHEVEIVTFTLQYPSFLYPGKTQYSSDPAPKGAKITRMINSVHPLTWLKTGAYIKSLKPDLVIVKFWLPLMGPAFGKILRSIRKNKEARVISILDNVIPHEHRPGDESFTKYFLRPVDGFVSMSQQVLTDLRSFESAKPAILAPHPVYDNYGDIIDKQLARKQLGIPEKEKTLLFFGFIRKYKGLDLLLEAMAEKRIHDAGIKLIIAGEYYGNKEVYQKMIEDLQLQDQLHLFTDFIPDHEVGKYFSAADCVVQPYRSATQSGISQIAYYFEKPMIVTNVGGLPEIVKDGEVGFVVPPEKNVLASAILKFFEQDSEALFHTNLVKEKARYSWSNFVNQIMGLYDQIK